MSSVIAGFRTTGVYPFDRHALQPAGSTPTRFNPASLSERTGLNFIPLYSPARQRSVASSPSVATFTKDEMVRFQRQVEEGYDLPPVGRYSLWLKMYRPGASSPSSDGTQPTEHQLFLDDDDGFPPATPPNCPPTSPSFLVDSRHEHLPQLKRTTQLSKSLSSLPTVSALKYRAIEPKSSARVLTSTENLRNMEEKQNKKEEEERKKKERQVERMAKRAEKEKLEVSKKEMRQERRQKKYAEKEEAHGQVARTT